MTTYARIVNGEAVDVVTADPAALYHPDVAATFETVPDDVRKNWRLIEGVWTAPEERPTPEAAQEPEVQAFNYVALTFVEFISVVQAYGGVTDDEAVEILATSEVSSIVLVRLMLEKMDKGITRDNPVMLGGLQKLISAGYLTEAEKEAILDNWPTV